MYKWQSPHVLLADQFFPPLSLCKLADTVTQSAPLLSTSQTLNVGQSTHYKGREDLGRG